MKNFLKKSIDWFAKTGFLKFLWRKSGKLFKYAIYHLNAVIVFYDDKEKSKVIELIKSIKLENKMLLENNEAYQLYMAVVNTRKIEGEIAEIGSYMGGSAKLICEAKEEKSLHLFDTFEGLPDLSQWDNPSQFQKGNFNSSIKFVENYLKKYSNVFLYKGLFPDTASTISNKKFSLVHIDVDLFEATRDSIEFFYPKMNKGGIIISHDYDEPGVRKAFDDFFIDKPEPIIEMSGCQCLVVKI